MQIAHPFAAFTLVEKYDAGTMGVIVVSSMAATINIVIILPDIFFHIYVFTIIASLSADNSYGIIA